MRWFSRKTPQKKGSYEEQASEILSALNYSYAQCVLSQGHILFEPQSSVTTRYQRFADLAASFMRTGIVSPDERLVMLSDYAGIDAPLIQEVLWKMYTSSSAQDIYTFLLSALTSASFQETLYDHTSLFRRIWRRLFRRRTQSAYTPSLPGAFTSLPVSQVPRAQRTTRRRANGWRSDRGISVRYHTRSMHKS